MASLDSGGGGEQQDEQEQQRRQQQADQEATEQLTEADQGSSSGGSEQLADDMQQGVTSGGGETARSASQPSGPREQADQQLTDRDPGSGASRAGSGMSEGGVEAAEDTEARPQEASDASTGRAAARGSRGGLDAGAGAEAAAAASQREQDLASVEQEVARQQVSTTLEEGIEGRAGDGRRQELARDLEQRVIEENPRVDSPDDVVIVERDGQLVAQLSRSAQVAETAEELDLDDQVLRGVQSDQRPAGTGLDPGEATGVAADAIDREDLEFSVTDGELDVQVSQEAQQDIAEARTDQDAIRADLRREVASENPNIEPEDVEVVREGERFVARAQVEVEQATREERLLPSVDVDVANRSVDVEGGDLSAIPEPTPARVFGTVAGLEEEGIQEIESRAENVSEDTQGAPPIGLGGGRTLPIRGAAAAGAALGAAAVASEPGPNDVEVAENDVTLQSEQEIQAAEVGIGDAVIDSELDVGSGTPTSEVEVGRAPNEISELDAGSGAGVSPTTVEPGDTVTETEVSLPEESSEPAGEREVSDESVVPGEFPLAGRDYPLDPSQERRTRTRPEDLIGTGAEAAPLQEQISPEEVIVDEEIQRRRRSRNPELDEILRGPPEEVTIGEEPSVGFPGQREFPTGASAVVGRELGMVSEAAELEVLQEAESPAEQLDARGPIQTNVPAVGVGEDVNTATDLATDVTTRQVTEQALELGLQQEALLEDVQATETVTPTETVFENVVEQGFEYGAGTGAATSSDFVAELSPDSTPDPDRRPRFDFFEREIVAPVEENPLSSIDEDLENL